MYMAQGIMGYTVYYNKGLGF